MAEIEQIRAGKYECARLGGGVEVPRDGVDPKEVHDAAELFSVECKWQNNNDACTEEDGCAVRQLRLLARKLMNIQVISPEANQ